MSCTNQATSSGCPPTIHSRLEYQTNFVKGLDGKSAYQFAVEGGYPHSEEQFYIDLGLTGFKPIATISDLGYIIVGNGLVITPEGILSVDLMQLVSGDLQLGDEIEVSGIGQMGGFKDGDIVPATTTMYQMWARLLAKEVPPIYLQPILSILVNHSGTIELGDIISPTIISNFLQNDAGELESIIISMNGETIASGSSDLEVIDYSRKATSSQLVYSSTVSYKEGPIKNTNFGNPYPDGRIPAGTMTNIYKLYAHRNAFYGAEPTPGSVTTSAEIRGLVDKFSNPEQGSEFTLVAPVGTRRVVIAYPVILGEISSIYYVELGDEYKDVFKETYINVEGANGFDPTPYRVYQWVVPIAFGGEVTFKVKI
jgi:hypothetical protein